MKLIQYINFTEKKEITLKETWLWERGSNLVEFAPHAPGCQIFSNFEIKINNKRWLGARKLAHNDVIEIKDEMYIYKDESEAERRESETERRIQKTTKLEKKYDTKEVEDKIKKRFCDFVNEISPTSALDFLRALASFLKKTYKIDRIIFYKFYTDEKGRLKAKGIVTLVREKYVPSMTLLRKIYSTGNAHFWEVCEMEDSSRSIIDNQIRSAFGIPIFYKNSPYFLLYGDSLQSLKTVATEIDYLCRYSSTKIKELLLEKDFKDDLNDLKVIDI